MQPLAHVSPMALIDKPILGANHTLKGVAVLTTETTTIVSIRLFQLKPESTTDLRFRLGDLTRWR